MTTARLNFTQRLRIPAEQVAISVDTSAQPARLTASFNLAGLGLEAVPGSEIVVEAGLQTQMMRFSGGTVSSPRMIDALPLHDFSDPAGLTYRVKVIDPVGKRLLAVADRVKAKVGDGEAGAESLLPIRSSDELGDVGWSLDLEDRPLLKINSRLGDKEAVASSSEFIGFVYPEVVRQIAMWVIAEDPDPEDVEDDASVWLRFLSELGADVRKMPKPDDDDGSKRLWADNAVRGFASANQLMQLFEQEVGE